MTHTAMAGTRPSMRAAAIARGLLRTGRAIGVVNFEYGMLRLQCRIGGNYWISRNGRRVYQGKTLLAAFGAQSGFIATMSRAGRRRSHDASHQRALTPNSRLAQSRRRASMSN